MDTDALCLHECEIIGEGGTYWPSPTFKVTARDREDEPVEAKSCTGCWSQVGGQFVRMGTYTPWHVFAKQKRTGLRGSCSGAVEAKSCTPC